VRYISNSKTAMKICCEKCKLLFTGLEVYRIEKRYLSLKKRFAPWLLVESMTGIEYPSIVDSDVNPNKYSLAELSGLTYTTRANSNPTIRDSPYS